MNYVEIPQIFILPSQKPDFLGVSYNILAVQYLDAPILELKKSCQSRSAGSSFSTPLLARGCSSRRNPQ